MKKNFGLLFFVIMLFTITACSDKKIEDKIATCSIKTDTHYENVILNGTNGKVTRFEATYEYINEAIGIENMENVSSEQKQLLVDNMYTNLGFEKEKVYDGFDIDITVTDKLIVKFSGDINNKSATESFKKLGLDFSNTDLNFKNAIKSYEDSGYNCK